MNLKNLSNEVLDKNLQLLVCKEREILAEILLHVCEVDRRKLFIDYAFPNLFAYMTGQLGYSAGSAQRRIDAARLSREVPDLVESLESGALNLSQVSIVQKAVRQVFRESHTKITGEQKQELLTQLEGRSFEESQIIVAQAFDIKIQTAPRIQHQADESVRLEISFTKDQWAKMEQMQTLLSHSLPSGSWTEVFEYLANKVIQQKRKPSNKAILGNDPVMGKCLEQIESRIENQSKADTHANIHIESNFKFSEGDDEKFYRGGTAARTYIPAAISGQVFQRDQCCQFVDKKSGRKCTSRWQLQIDHIRPVWAGGDSSVTNLQLLCANHNQARYKKQAGIRTALRA